MEILRDLATRLTGTDHHDRSGWQQFAIFIVGGMDLVNRRRDPLGQPRNGGILVAAGRYNHLISGENADVSSDFEGLGIVPLQPSNRHPFVDRWSERLGIRFDVSNDL